MRRGIAERDAMAGRRGEAWNNEDEETLRRMSAAGERLSDIARALERSQLAVQNRASRMKLKTRS